MSSPLDYWIAFGQATPVLALAVVCVACAAIAGLVLGGLAITHGGTIPLPSLALRTRRIVAIATSVLGAASLGLMLRLMALGDLNWVASVGLYAGAMTTFVGINLCQNRAQGVLAEAAVQVREQKKAA